MFNKWVLVTLLVLCWAIAASFEAGWYYYQYSDLSSKVKEVIITANLGIDYNNGSAIRWFNETKISAGSTLLDFTKLVSSVNYTTSISGTTVNAIDDVSNSNPKWWVWWSHSSYGWTFGPVACDRYIVGENETILWYRQDLSTYPPPQP